MWTIFSRDASKDFPFEVIECPSYQFNEQSLWKLNKGKKKNTNQEVSIFEFTTNDNFPGNDSTLAKCAVKHLKTLKHPNILSFVESSEVKTTIYLSTEYVEPLQSFLLSQNELNTIIMKQYIAWGLYNVIEGLKFLNVEAKLCHNKVCIWSVFVNKAGQWKLGELEYMNSVDSSPPSNVNDLYRAPGHQKLPFSIDVWGLGVLIWEIFNGPLNHQSALKNIKKIPKEIQKVYSKLVDADPIKRPSYDHIIMVLREEKYFGNDLEKTMTSLSQYHLLDDSQRIVFLEKLPNLLDNFPKNIAQYNVLPSLVGMFNYIKEQKVVFPAMIKLSSTLNDLEFEEKITPCIVKLYESNDRATRLLLLNQMEAYANRLKPDLLNTTIFPLIASGLADASPVIRELTVRSMVHLGPKLNHNNLNVELMRHFARLQMKDDQGNIRTNTTVCLGKIAQYLDSKSRSKILASAFSRALKDPFPPSRMAGVSAFSATQQYYSLSEVSTRVLPALCQVTLDNEKGVRDITFQTIKGFLGKLENVSEDPKFKEKLEEEISNSANIALPTWTWASTVTSKFYSSKNPIKADEVSKSYSSGSNNGQIHNNSEKINNLNEKNNGLSEKKQEELINILQETQTNTNLMSSSTLSSDWDDDNSGSGWDVDNWETVGINSSNSGTDETNFGWDDQNLSLQNEYVDKKVETDLQKEEMRRKREEKKQERLKQLESKRISKQNLKLGGRKL